MVAQGLHIGNVEQISHNAARGAAAPRAHRDISFPTEIDEIPHNEKIGIVAHIIDNLQLELQALANLLVHHRIALGQRLLAQVTQIASRIIALGHGKLRQ